MKYTELSIPNMQSAHCETRVSNAAKQIEGVQIKNLGPERLTVSVSSDDLKSQLIKAITKVGYSVAFKD